MRRVCSRCNKLTNKLIHLDDAEASAAYTELLNVRYEVFNNICVSCALDELGIDQSDFVDESPHQNQTQFLLDLMKGNIAQVVVKTILQEFNYEVYPYGYENYLSSMSKSISTSNSNISARRIRSTPDLFVYDIKSKESFLVEVKATAAKEETKCFISKSKLDDYAKYWQEAILIMYCLFTGNLYCNQIRNIDLTKLPTNTKFGKPIYELDLKGSFQSIPDVFKSVDVGRYLEFQPTIQEVLKQFSH